MADEPPGDRWLELRKTTGDLCFVDAINIAVYEAKGYLRTGRWALWSDYQDACRTAQRFRGIGRHGNGVVYWPVTIYSVSP